MKLFVQLQKVDLERRLVYGRATQEIVDKSGEIFDYATSKPLFEQWSNDALAATKAAGTEASLGNVRAMHGPTAAGKLTELHFDDVEKAIDVVAEVVDENEWQKVKKGVYTGFSIGGAYAKRWTEAGARRFTAAPAEISLVDNPCVPTARFAMVKANGLEELTAFAAVDGASTDEAIAASVASDLIGKTTLVSTLEGGPGGVIAVDPVSGKPVAPPAASSAAAAAAEAPANPPAPADRRAADDEAQLQALAAAEAAGALPDADRRATDAAATTVDPAVPADPAKAAADALAKAGARHSAADMARLQGIHDHSVSMGASCGAEKVAPSELQKRADEALQKLESLEKAVASLTGERDALQKKVAELEAIPLPPKGVARDVTVTKAADNDAAARAAATTIELPNPATHPKEFSLAVMKLALAKPTA